MTLQILELTNEDIDLILPLENELYHKPWLKKDYEYELKDNPFAIYLKMIDKDSNEIMGYIEKDDYLIVYGSQLSYYSTEYAKKTYNFS